MSANDREYVNANIDEKIRNNPGLEFLRYVKALWRFLNEEAGVGEAAMILGALAYFISPIDAIPDVLFPIGYADDAGVIMAVVAFLGYKLNKYLEVV